MDRLVKKPAGSRRARGEAITELALIAPVLLLVLFGIYEMGRVVDAWLIVHNAAREGARIGAVSYTGSTPGLTAAQAAASAANAYLDRALVVRRDIAGRSVTAPEVLTEEVAVTASVQVQLYTPIIASLLNQQAVPVGATARMRRQ